MVFVLFCFVLLHFNMVTPSHLLILRRSKDDTEKVLVIKSAFWSFSAIDLSHDLEQIRTNIMKAKSCLHNLIAYKGISSVGEVDQYVLFAIDFGNAFHSLL